MSKDEPAGAAVAERPQPVVDSKPAHSAVLARSAIVRSRTNPRTHFDDAYIKGLAESIREQGVITPLLVRPLPAARLQDTFEDRKKGEPLPTHEIVCGECRWRAASLAGVDELPVLVRHLGDVQVLQVQLVENLKRRNLHPLEEAEGFERLVKDHGLSVDDIAAKITKSASYVWKIMKLLELTPECREILYQGKLSQSTALLVARAPGYLQKQIAGDIMKGQHGSGDEPMSFRQAAQHIQHRYMLRLSDAPFDIKDEGLVPKAGSCKACPKRTGANTDLFEDVKHADTCTDPKCFDGKKVAHVERLRKDAEARGQTVIAGREAKEIVAHQYSDQLKGYRNLDEKDWFGGEHKSLRQVLGKDAPVPVLIEHPRSHKLIEALPNATVSKLLKDKGLAKAASPRNAPAKKDPGREIVEQWKTQCVDAIYAGIVAGKMKDIHVDVGRFLGRVMAGNVSYGAAESRIVRLLEIGKIGKNAAIEDYFDKCPASMVGAALLLMVMEDELDQVYSVKDKHPMLDLFAKQTGMDLKAIEEKLKSGLRQVAAEEKATSKKPAAPKATPAAAKKVRARSPNPAFMQPMHCSAALQAIVGAEPIARTEIVTRLWKHVKKNKLQDTVNKRMVNCDDKLKAVFGKASVSMFEMAGLIGKQVSVKAFIAAPEQVNTTATNSKTPARKAVTSKAADPAISAKLNAVAAWPFPTASKP